jgi:dTDP-4-amino-4,6-dideoxygalactose transaminase
MKSFAAGELGILVTNDRKIYERALAFGHYERNNEKNIIECDELKQYYNVAIGGIKGRANQVCTALARVQLKYYDERCREIRKAMNYFWDLLEGVKGLHAIRVDESTGSNMGGWYCPHGLYRPEELGGLSSKRFALAMRAEGVDACFEGGNYCLHTHALFHNFDRFASGAPTRVAFSDRDARIDDEKCRPSEAIQCVQVPWFKHYEPEWIEAYANAFKKVIDNYELLLEKDSDTQGGRWHGTTN